MVTNKRIKVAGIPWHVGHQYEIAKMPFIESYNLLINPYRTWGTNSRPIPDKVKWVTDYEDGYDVMIAHIDQQSIWDPDLGDRIHKGRLFLEAVKAFEESNPGKPVVVINHMTPFHDKYEPRDVVEKIKRSVGDRYMVVNSYQSEVQWGWGHAIIHGQTPEEWWDRPKEPRIVCFVSSGGMERAYRRQFLYAVMRLVKEQGVPFVWLGVDHKCGSFDAYREFLGRSLVYFNPTWQSPRPRTRTEAMHSGCCIVTTPYHTWKSRDDYSSYFEEGVTGFLTSKQEIKDPRVMDNPEYCADLLCDLVLNRPDEARAVGQAGKEYAKKNFHIDSFTAQWQKVLEGLNVL